MLLCRCVVAVLQSLLFAFEFTVNLVMGGYYLYLSDICLLSLVFHASGVNIFVDEVLNFRIRSRNVEEDGFEVGKAVIFQFWK